MSVDLQKNKLIMEQIDKYLQLQEYLIFKKFLKRINKNRNQNYPLGIAKLIVVLTSSHQIILSNKKKNIQKHQSILQFYLLEECIKYYKLNNGSS